MIPAGKHFVLYEPIDSGVIIVTIVHCQRNIEDLLMRIGSELITEVDRAREQFSK